MTKLSSGERNKLSGSEFAGPNRSYPVPDVSHSINAKARATQQFNQGSLSKGSMLAIKSKANHVIKGSKRGG